MDYTGIEFMQGNLLGDAFANIYRAAQEWLFETSYPRLHDFEFNLAHWQRGWPKTLDLYPQVEVR